MNEKIKILRYVLTSKDRGFTHHYINGIDTKMNSLRSFKRRIEIFLHLIFVFITREIK